MMINIQELQALYIHIPFCKSICTYCDFYKMVARTSSQEKYVDYLIKEIHLKKDCFSDIKTVYIGGGTPSSLPLSSLNNLLETLWLFLDSDKVYEFTIEANPNDINKEFINVLKNNKVNRVSLGVQSFNDEKLMFLGRKHDKKIATNAIRLLQENGLNNISCDLIYATPDDSFQNVKKDLDILIKLKIPHISCYSLILEKKTVLYHKFLKNEFELMDEDIEYNLYVKLNNHLALNGYTQYEISNYSLPNMESNHNLVYWHNKHYLGIGAGASYYIDNVRYTNIMNLERYYEGIDKKVLNYQEIKELSKLDQMQEEMLLGLRKIKGINILDFYNKFNQDIYETFPIINELIKKDLLAVKDDYIFIPKHRLYLSNAVLVNFI